MGSDQRVNVLCSVLGERMAVLYLGRKIFLLLRTELLVKLQEQKLSDSFLNHLFSSSSRAIKLTCLYNEKMSLMCETLTFCSPELSSLSSSLEASYRLPLMVLDSIKK